MSTISWHWLQVAFQLLTTYCIRLFSDQNYKHYINWHSHAGYPNQLSIMSIPILHQNCMTLEFSAQRYNLSLSYLANQLSAKYNGLEQLLIKSTWTSFIHYEHDCIYMYTLYQGRGGMTCVVQIILRHVINNNSACDQCTIASLMSCLLWYKDNQQAIL